MRNSVIIWDQLDDVSMPIDRTPKNIYYESFITFSIRHNLTGSVALMLGWWNTLDLKTNLTLSLLPCQPVRISMAMQKKYQSGENKKLTLAIAISITHCVYVMKRSEPVEIVYSLRFIVPSGGIY